MNKLVLVIGNKNYSSWSLRPWVFMKYYGIKFKEIKIPLLTESTDKELAPYNSNYKVPVLQDNKILVWDTMAILEYVSENYLDSKGWPVQRDAKALARSMSNEMHSSFMHIREEFPMNCRKTFKNIFPSESSIKEIERVKDLWRQAKERFGQNGKWLFSDYSIADAMFAPIALRFYGYNIALDPVSKDYVQSVVTQGAIVEWVEAGKSETEVIEQDEL